MNTSYKLLIDGEQIPATSGATLDAVNPYTGAAFATIPDASLADVQSAYDAAQSAFETTWVRTPGVERARLMHRLADLLESKADEFGRLESLDNGKLLSETRGQAKFAARNYRFFAGYADKLYGRTIPMDSTDVFDYTLREPVGVAALITAWNSPMQLLANKLAPALAAGNTVVVKPSEHASITTLQMAELIDEAGFPPGVINIVTGADAGIALTKIPGLGRISFTGSVPTGQAIAATAAQNLIPVTLELGGKSPNIIFDDADLDQAIVGALAGIFAAGGQTCIAGSRLLVQESVYDAVVERIGQRADQIRLGDPFDPGTQMGPVANAPQYTRLQAVIEDGVTSGARQVAGRQPIAASSGLFIRPTVFADVDNSSALAQHEIFGPVLSIIKFSTEQEAIRIANETDYGLASGVWTRDLSRAHRVARDLIAGTVWVNTYRMSAAQAPFGGMRRSGYGRERGEEALAEYTRTKNVMINLSGSVSDPFGASA